MAPRHVFFLSDHTALTAEALGKSWISQFPEVEWVQSTLPYVNDEAAAQAAVAEIDRAFAASGARPVVVSTVLDPHLSEVVRSSRGLVLEALENFMAVLEQELGQKARRSAGKVHSAAQQDSYLDRIDAIQYSLECDDGAHLDEVASADLVLLGVSRSGKTPTSLYMAMHYGLRTANVPLTAELLNDLRLPSVLTGAGMQGRLFGLDLQPDRLMAIRQARWPGSEYSSRENCESELADARTLFRRHGIPSVDMTWLSIEEVGARILDQLHLSSRN